MNGLPTKVELQVVTPDRQLVHEEVDEVHVPGRNGYLGILPGHAPLLGELQLGELSYRQGDRWTHLSVFWGFVEVLPDRVIVLAQRGERADEIDIERARRSKERAEERLRKGGADLDWDRAQVSLTRAVTRLHVASRAGTGVPR